MNISSPSIRVSVGGQPGPGPRHPEASPEPGAEHRRAFTPPIDIHEGPEGLTLEADLPGATEDNLFIQLEDNVLSLHARIESPVPQGGRLIHEEYPVGDYYRSFILSDEVDRDRITAELKNGVLRLVLPKADRARTRRIEIRS
ncbi:MAG: Hsp20/alpha crystallin family protein [Isosphaeraceae bacterium]